MRAAIGAVVFYPKLPWIGFWNSARVGSSIRNVDSMPGVDSTQMRPPCISTIGNGEAQARAALGLGVGAVNQMGGGSHLGGSLSRATFVSVLRAVLFVLLPSVDGARGRSDAGQHGQSQKCRENYLHDGIPYANNATLSRLATNHAVIA